VRVERILAEDVRDLACGGVAEKHVTNRKEEREIETVVRPVSILSQPRFPPTKKEVTLDPDGRLHRWW